MPYSYSLLHGKLCLLHPNVFYKEHAIHQNAFTDSELVRLVPFARAALGAGETAWDLVHGLDISAAPRCEEFCELLLGWAAEIEHHEQRRGSE